MRLAVGLFCLLPMGAFAQGAWETWEDNGKTIAGICTADTEEICAAVFCDIATASVQIAWISPGAWTVQAGAKENLVLQIGGGETQVIAGEIAAAPGFSLEFYAVAGALSPSQINGLRASSAFSLGPQNGDLAALSLAGSSAAISRALGPSCG
ncbi:MAG: hypothetical protein AAFP85_08785 [Pseudomonadota bacterium]